MTRENDLLHRDGSGDRGTARSSNRCRRSWPAAAWPLPMLALVAFSFTLLAPYPVKRVARALGFPYQLDAEEGFLLGQALRLRAGQGLYQSVGEAPYVVDNYPPLYPALWSVAARWSGESLSPGRWISALSALAAALAILTVIMGHGPPGVFAASVFSRKRERKSGEEPPGGRAARGVFPLEAGQTALLAWSCALMFLSSYALMRWVGYARVDLLSVALSVWGLVVFGLGGSGEKGKASRAVAVALFALGLLAKQSSVAAPAACVLWLATRDRKRAAWFALAVVLAAGLPAAALCVWTGGRYWSHTVTYNRNVMNWNELILQARHLWRFYAPAIVAAGLLTLWAIRGAAWGGGKRSDGETARIPDPHLTLYLLYFGLNILSLAALAKAGAAENYFLEPICAAAIFVGVTLGALLGKMLSESGRRPTTAFAFAVLALLVFHGIRYCGVGGLHDYNGRLAYHSAPSPTLQALVQGDKVVREIAKRPGPVLCEDPIYLLRAGKTIVFQNFIMTQLASEGKWDETPFVERVERGEFSLVVAHKDLGEEKQFFNRYSPALRAALRRRYRLLERLDRRFPLQPIYLYVPKPPEPKP